MSTFSIGKSVDLLRDEKKWDKMIKILGFIHHILGLLFMWIFDQFLAWYAAFVPLSQRWKSLYLDVGLCSLDEFLILIGLYWRSSSVAAPEPSLWMHKPSLNQLKLSRISTSFFWEFSLGHKHLAKSTLISWKSLYLDAGRCSLDEFQFLFLECCLAQSHGLWRNLQWLLSNHLRDFLSLLCTFNYISWSYRASSGELP
jgi:hypothetical protein